MTTGERPLPDLVADGVDRTLALAQTWLRWDGRPCVGEDASRIYTPHKSLRRYADHLLDHLAELECVVAGVETIPDGWIGSTVTLAIDWPPFTEADFTEARERLLRLARLYRLRLEAWGPDEWDRERPGSWTVREIVEHVADAWYAEQVGDLSRRLTD